MTAMPPSLWAKTAIAGPNCAQLDGRCEADTVIIGAGYTGCSAALHLAREGQVVRVLEANEPGWGCSGRNGGQVNPGGTRVTPDEILDLFGPERGERFITLGNETCDLVFDLIERYGIDCDALRPGYVQGGWRKQGLDYQHDWVTQWQRYGVDAQLLDAAAIQDLIGSEHYDHGMYDPRGGNVQPLSYARGLANAAVSEGATIYANAKATHIKKQQGDWCVTTAGGGQVFAKQLLIATNGYTDDLWPGLKETVVPVCSFVAATEPLSHNLSSTILPGKHAVSEAGRIIVYYRMDRDGRFVIGGRGNWLDIKQDGDDSHVREVATRLYPQLGNVEWEYHWGGWPAITKNHLPMLMALAPGAYAGLGYNGRGVATATMMGKQLALAVLGEAPGLDVQLLDKFAFHAFRQLGITWRLVSGTLLDRRPAGKPLHM